MDGYKHVVDVEYCPPVASDGPHFPPEAAKAKEAAQKEPSIQHTVEYHEIMEGNINLPQMCQFTAGIPTNGGFSLLTEEMIRGLQQLGWKKVDVSFHSAFWPFFAHNNIHVRTRPNFSFGDVCSSVLVINLIRCLNLGEK